MTEIESFKKTIEELARNFKAGSFDLKRLSEWVKLTSDDLLKTINQREKAIKERDEARAEVETWKGVVGKQSAKISALEARPEPSRLEIAAMIYAAWSSNSIVTRFLLDGSGPDIWTEKEALRDADALIAASKEEVAQ